MTTLKFQKHRLSNLAPDLNIEQVFRQYAAWGDLHQQSFDDAYTLSASNWTGIILPTLVGTTLTFDASAEPAGWHASFPAETSLPVSLTFSYDKSAVRQGACIVGSGFAYLIVTNASGNPEVYVVNSTSWDLVMALPVTCPTNAHVEIVFRQHHFSDLETDYWHSLALYMNGHHILTYSTSAGAPVTGLHVGLAWYGGDAVSYSNFRIPELCEQIEVADLDPGETAISGISRAMEGRNLKYFVRYNGQFRAWRSKATAVVEGLTNANGLVEGDVQVDTSSLYTHVRLIGAYLWAEYISTALMAKYGHRFEEVNNSMLMTEEDCYAEAQRIIQRMEEQAVTEPVAMIGLPLLELEDRVTTPQGDWLVGNIGLEYHSARIIENINLKKYVWGE